MYWHWSTGCGHVVLAVHEKALAKRQSNKSKQAFCRQLARYDKWNKLPIAIAFWRYLS